MKFNWHDVAEGLGAALELQRRELAEALGQKPDLSWGSLLGHVQDLKKAAASESVRAYQLAAELAPLKQREERRKKRKEARAKGLKLAPGDAPCPSCARSGGLGCLTCGGSGKVPGWRRFVETIRDHAGHHLTALQALEWLEQYLRSAS